MQIKEIVLYNNDGTQKRTLPFNTGKVNIISGKSSTGKSTIIDIVDYCLGDGSCSIPRNIRKAVSWFGIKLAFENSEIFIARKNPTLTGSKTTADAFFMEGEKIEIPDFAPKEANANMDDIEEILSSKMGIGLIKFIPNKNQSRQSFQVNLRHALFYCFQQQGIISSENLLFGGMEEPFKKLDLKNTLPYFLGAIREDKVDLLNEKQILERKLRQKIRKLEENENIKGEGFSKGISLILECQNIGLIDSNIEIPAEVNGIYELLKKAHTAKPKFDVDYRPSEEINNLIQKNEEIKIRIREINQELKAIEFRVQTINSYEEAKAYQEIRLKSIELYEGLEETNSCPLCCNPIENKIPRIESVKKAFEDINNSLGAATVSFPKLQNRANSLKSELSDLRENLKLNKENILDLQRQEAKFEELRNIENKYLLTVGRISLWLESVDTLDEKDDIQKEIVELQKRIREINQLLDQEKEQEKLNYIFDAINKNMTARNYNLVTNIEHKFDKIGYDHKYVRVMIYDEEENEYFPLTDTGSQQTYLYYHLITLMAFHNHFIKHKRPVPRFLFLDQPSQVYFLTENPRKKELEETGKIDDDERDYVINLFNLIFDFINEQNNNFQIIIMDHANLNDEKFQNALIEEWRDGRALVPYDWMPENQEKI